MNKTLIVSDIHLNSNFEPNKFEYLYNLFTKHQHIIINGDFFDIYSNKFEEITKTRWQQLFPILKAKNTIYIYGNHDREEWINDNKYKFCKIATNYYTFNVNDTSYFLTHGHNYKYDSIHNELFMKFHRNFKVYEFSRALKDRMLNYYGYDKFIKIGKPINSYYKKNIKKNTTYLITGHSHAPEIDYENNYINAGFIDHGYANYITISEQGPELITEKY